MEAMEAMSHIHIYQLQFGHHRIFLEVSVLHSIQYSLLVDRPDRHY